MTESDHAPTSRRVHARLSALEVAIEALQAQVIAAAKPDERRRLKAATPQKAPGPGLRYPAGWRTLTAAQRRAKWKDLARWTDWLIEAYRMPPKMWGAWWETPGVCEELAALRAWHHELVDVFLAETPKPDSIDPDRFAEWERRERALRTDRARGLVDWHESLWRVVGRLAGVSVQQKPLMAREAEATKHTTLRRKEEANARRSGLDAWLVRGSVTGCGTALDQGSVECPELNSIEDPPCR